MRKTSFMLAAAVFAALSFQAPLARAAPFCVEAEGLPDECWYYDIRLCQQEAEKKEGYCTASKEEMAVSEKDGDFCIVDSSLVPLCMFQNGEDCQASAANRHAVCFENAKTENYDPHHLDRALYRN